MLSGSERDPLLRNMPEDSKSSVNISTNSSESEADDQSPFQRFLSAINPIDTENWAEMGIFKKIYEVFKVKVVRVNNDEHCFKVCA
jgi:hypothetical protein